ncbi:pirin family protein [Caldivirga maquilingensis]|uniref:Pirin domain protein n=1 Tax=Caldivirga maquilingensis (strain ATCC 700844 / DSM 13496 / JCM 10307 / IC-167) TaxID=397948 RepID=A8ME68_CALMQ|nr:pirin family protein [Caldivirga maquilingensis]ABW02074.1 Pirin domain protein [Caldivirga maquilingensis IC-167]
MVRKTVEAIIKGTWTRDGAGVKLYRVFGSPELVDLMDPFLLLDHFGSRYPHEYLMGFPWHPHRGIETVTYLLKGEVHHRDSTGVKGVLGEGDVQWMTAGSGIFHEEMPKPGRRMVNGSVIEDPEVSGFQLWVNLPRVSKMSRPKYRNLSRNSVPRVILDNGVKVTLISGRVKAPGYGIVEGPINDLATPVNYIDVLIPEESTFSYEVKDGYTALIYVINGSLIPGNEGNPVASGQLVVYSRDGGEINVRTMDKPARFLLLAGRPINEPVAWYGPIVMNTWDELEEAFTELRAGTFIKHEPEVNDID